MATAAMFSYAVAVQDVWAFHWHNISGRTSVYLLALLPAETLVAITGNPGPASPLMDFCSTSLHWRAWRRPTQPIARQAVDLPLRMRLNGPALPA